MSFCISASVEAETQVGFELVLESPGPSVHSYALLGVLSVRTVPHLRELHCSRSAFAIVRPDRSSEAPVAKCHVAIHPCGPRHRLPLVAEAP